MRKMNKLIKLLEDNGLEVLHAEWNGDTLEIDTSDNNKANEIMIDDGYHKMEVRAHDKRGNIEHECRS